MPHGSGTASAVRRPQLRRLGGGLALALILGLSANESISTRMAWLQYGMGLASRRPRPQVCLLAGEIDPIDKVRAGDRFVGWLKHPVLTRSAKFDCVLEVGPGDEEGTWRIERPRKKPGAPIELEFEGPFKIKPADVEGNILMRDLETVFNATLNGAGPGTLSGRVIQNGLMWGGFFEVRLDD
eukprot:TRINITY_DN47194_c0_g1_i1.p2 TRINITY_DN47194_c0_g1~~TRINITY_DN47194_c0_g1_i1.p2  ORF type:complete len:183 (+),score=29.24 TRINITY_DN47194_c0_g1_i1:64-612(+)